MKKMKIFLTFVLTVITCCLFSLGLVTVIANSNGGLTFNGDSVQAKYYYGEKFTAPEGTLSFDGQTQDAQANLVFPDGREINPVMVTLNQEGIYTLEYSASFSGQVKTYEQTFTVEKKLFSVEKPASSVAYGTYDAAEHDRDELNVIGGTVSGAYVQLASGDTLTYNKVIDLAGKTANEVFIRLAMTPSIIGTQDVGAISIILTDAYDANNFVTINVLDSGEDWGAAYVKVAANCGQLLTGWDYSGNRLMTGTNPYGYAVYFLFSANAAKRPSITQISENSLQFSMDYAQRQVHYAGNRNEEFPSVIADLDSQEDFGNVWSGFTTGECFISIKCNEYITSTANFVISEIMGEPITSTGEFARSAPNVVVDFDGYEQTALPVGAVGEKYPLFAAKGVSPYYSGVTVSQKVFFDYAGVKRKMTVTDGYFTPDADGVYTVEIIATDVLGQSRVVTYDVPVAVANTPITVTPTGTYATTSVAGFSVKLADMETVGGSGRLRIQYAVQCEEVAIATDGDNFRPVKAGTYKVTATATDFLGKTDIYEYEVVVAAGTKPVFVDELILPKYFISGIEYALPQMQAKNYTDGTGSDVLTLIKYQDAKGERQAISGKITPCVHNSGDMTKVIYSAQINGVEETLTAEVPTIIVRDEAGISIEKLFVAQGNNVVTATNKNYVEFKFFEDTSYDFINPLIANGLDVKFSSDAIGASFGKVIITLTDSLNEKQSLTLSYTTDGSGALFSLNGSAATYKASKSLTKGTDVLAFTLDDVNRSLRFDTGNTLKIPLKQYADGSEYKGFESGLVYIKFSFENVSGASAFRVNNIAGKMMSNSKQDVARPKLSFLGDYGGNKALGAVATLPVIVGADVVDGKVPVYITVTAPNGKVMTDENGVLLENVSAEKNYQIKLSDYGRYTVSITTEDTDGNEYPYKFEIRVEDDVAPTLSVTGVPTAGKVGEMLVVPQATATDNMSAAKDLIVRTYLITETGNIYQMDVLAFTPQRAGVYTVRYYCIDEVGNITVSSFDIVVS